MQADVGEDILPLRVAEAHVRETDARAHAGQPYRIRRVAHFGLEVEDLEDALQSDRDVLHASPEYKEPAHGVRSIAEAVGEEAEQAHVPQREAAADEQAAREQR